MENTISEELLTRYFNITTEAFEMASKAPVNDGEATAIILDMVARYISDAQHFRSKGKWTLAYAALNYAHGWLDAGARLACFVVRDSRLFTVDGDD